jgi:hypothetical protein
VELVEDVQGLSPRVPGLPLVARGIAGVGEVDEDLRFRRQVAELPDEAERALVAGGGFGEITQVVLGVAQAVPGDGLVVAQADFGGEGY